MKKEIYCHLCNILVANLELGSTLRKGSKIICRECMSKIETKIAADKFANLGKNDNTDFMKTLNNIFGGKL